MGRADGPRGEREHTESRDARGARDRNVDSAAAQCARTGAWQNTGRGEFLCFF